MPGTRAGLKPQDVGVEFREKGKFDVMQNRRLTITIDANAYPERQKVLEDANEAIAAEVARLSTPKSKGYIPISGGWVWTKLAPAAFRKFP